jgi:zinc protease
MLKESEQGKAHNSYWMNTLSYYYKTGINQNDPKNFEEVISSLTTKDIQKFTKKMFKNVNVIDLIFAPAAK